MSMKITRLRTYWSADDAYLVISFLDELRDQLWESYGDDICVAQWEQAERIAEAEAARSRQIELPFPDVDEF